MPRAFAAFTAALIAVFVTLFAFVPTPVAAQTGEPVVETDPVIPTVDNPVTIFFNADQGDQGLIDFTGDVYAHTGVYTSESPNEWTCVKNYWPTEDSFSGNRSDTQLERVSANRYKLEIQSIRDFYNANATGCTLGTDEVVQTMNFVFRNADGSREAKATGGQDIIVDLGDATAPVLVDFASPSVSAIDPIVTDQNQTVQVEAAATTAGDVTLQSMEITVNGTQVASSPTSPITYDLVLDTPGRYDVEVTATAEEGSQTVTATDAFYAVRAEATQEQMVPAGLEDGINYTGPNSVTLVLQAPDKNFVHVIGDFTDWEVDPAYQMKREQNTASNGRDSTRYWLEVTGLNEGQEYGFQYFVDGEIRIADPYSEKVLSTNDQFISNETYPNLKPYPTGKTEQLVSVLETGQTPFNFSAFERPEQKDLVIYELLVRDFIEKHDYQTLQDTLSYLDRMGVNAIELMPVSEFDGNLSWGYNPAMYFAADKFYGPAEELKQFIDLAHQNGIAVILDVVYNQATGQSPFVRLFNDGTFGAPTTDNPWVNREARHPFNVFNDNNHESPFTKYWLDRANEYWLTEFNVDGFRFDLSKGFTQNDTGDDVGAWSSYDQSRVDILTRMADQIWQVDDRAYVILEHFAAQDEEKVLAEYRINEGLPGMMLWNNMNDAYTEASMGYPEASDLSNTYYENRGLVVPNYITYMESHDEQWMMYRNITSGNSQGDYDITQLETALERQKLVGAFFFTVPGPRMMWQFGELGYGYGDSGEQCLEGAAGSCPSSAPGRTAEKPIRWDYRDPAQSPNRVKLYKAWSAMINLRNSHEVFTSTDTQVGLRVFSGAQDRRITLQHPTMDVVIAGNFGVTRTDVAPNFTQTGTWYDFFTGTELNIDDGEQSAAISMAPGEFHIYTSEPVATPEPGLVPYPAAAPAPPAPTALSVTPNFQSTTIDVSWTASTAPDVTAYVVYRGTSANFDTTGAAVATLDPGTTAYTDSDVSVGQFYNYTVVALDNDDQRSPAPERVSALLYPETVSISASRSFGQGAQQQDYRLVALPGDIERPVQETFEGTAGEQWQVYRDTGADSDFLQSFDGSSRFEFEPGRGFWAIGETSWSVSEDVPTVTLANATFGPAGTIPLREGWNIISNPLDRDVTWSDVEAVNGGSLQPLWSFDGTFNQASTFASARSGEAYYFNNTGGLGSLAIPYGDVQDETQTASKAASTSDVVALTARTVSGEHAGAVSSLQVGTSKEASDGVDALDVIAPPVQFETLSLRVEAADPEASARNRSLMRSIRKADGDGQVYPIRLTAVSGTVVDLTAETMGAQEVRLVDGRTGKSYNLAAGETASLSRPADAELTLLVGSQSFVEREQQKLLPDELTLWPNYPNPFSGKTQIEYTLPEDGHVRLEVYDILGRRVQVLVDERKAAGPHETTWDGTGANGRPLASGVYFGRLTVGGRTSVQKMTVIR